RERADRFDQRVLQEPIPAKQTETSGVADTLGALKRKVFADFGKLLPVLRAQIAWLLSGAPAAEDAVPNLRELLVRTHEVQVKAASRVLIMSAAVAGGWATLVPLSGAVVLPGTLVVESSVKKIQHPTGGVVAEIPVHDGMHVDAGTLVVRLDDTQLKANHRFPRKACGSTAGSGGRASRGVGKCSVPCPGQGAPRPEGPSRGQRSPIRRAD